MSQNSSTLLLVVLTICVQLCQAHDFLGRCSCPKTIKFIKGNISDFQVLEKRPGCDKTELIVTMEGKDSSTEKICMNTKGKMARAFLRCWEKINKDGNRKKECIDKNRKAVSTYTRGRPGWEEKLV
uniref:Chemokine interleukin-8-like domain-containing protein n=1 Tax=Echeneis naucrates TaxID=173247 RepID=A0A665W1Q6_ECHNA